MKRVEINSFVGYVGSYIFFGDSCIPHSNLKMNVLGLFVFWVLTPESVLHKIGITSYPNRSWAVAIMAVIPITLLYLLLMYQGLHLFNTSNIDSVNQIEGKNSNNKILVSLFSTYEQIGIQRVGILKNLDQTVSNFVLISTFLYKSYFKSIPIFTQ